MFKLSSNVWKDMKREVYRQACVTVTDLDVCSASTEKCTPMESTYFAIL
jgi:hypothetical protein